MGQVSAKHKTQNRQQNGQQNGSSNKQDNQIATCGETVVIDRLQEVFNVIKNNTTKNVDKNLTNTSLLFTTSKEKYLVKLISEGNIIPKNVVIHVVTEYCTHKWHMVYGSYGCSHGFILKKEDYLSHEIERCESFHKLNDDLICYKGKLYYPVDVLVNPFGEWKPENVQQEKGSVRGIYEKILQRWPMYQMFGTISDMSLFTSHQERYLIKLINDGISVPEEVISHVVDGCDNKGHWLNKNLGCCYGLILSKAEFDSHVYEVKEPVKGRQLGRIYGPDGKPVRDPATENFPNCELNHVINDRMECEFGILFYERDNSLSPCVKLLSKRKEECNLSYSCKKIVQAVYKRIKWKRMSDSDASKYYTWFENMHSWETYLIDLLEKGDDISIEIISHVLDDHDGCYIGAHMLDENYGCCCGFILKKDEFMLHDFNACKSHHRLNNELACENGKVYHISAPRESPSSGFPHLGGNPVSAQRLKGIIPQDDPPFARPPPAPAPPPPDYLDQ